MSDHASSQDVRPALGVVSYQEVGDVAFAFLVLQSQTDRLLKALSAKDYVEAAEIAPGLRSTIESTEKYIAPARRMAKWAGGSADEGGVGTQLGG